MSETPRTEEATDFTAPEKLRDCSATLERELAAMTARAELAERQVAVLTSHLGRIVPCTFCPIGENRGACRCGDGTCRERVAAWARAEAEGGKG